MESIFHERQEGSLCAQHCLNNLLQGEYFSPVELSFIAQQLDEEERMRMAEGGMSSEEYRTFLQNCSLITTSGFSPILHPEQQPSGNMDDSGFFSIQVISNALKVWGLELILFNSPEYQRLGIDPINEKSFICNYKEHWFTVRKLGKQWFNLNSLLTGPELISDTYLALFLAQLQQEGYSIFVVKGDLPDCEADQLLQMVRVQQIQRPKLIGEETAQSRDQRLQKSNLDQAVEVNHPFDGTGMLDEDEENFQKALALSRHEIDMEDEEADLRRAIQLSMQGDHQNEFSGSISRSISQSTSTSLTESLSSEELRRRRQAYFEKQQQQLQQQEHASNLHDKPTTSSDALGMDPGVYFMKATIFSMGCQ
ncbi:ataxin-3 isoform X2 [Alligator sinensis]|uniref:ubiquitinyl hydrolase 1 n=1 Tax=Alligator sinensis TaxID=38654 RepID=A0A3Q0HFB4_ALLSI|nr:ataxin-3 isoform X2 [Alligator sinensis]